MRMTRLFAGIVAAFSALGAAGLAVGERVDNFALLDQHGQAHELYYLSDAKVVALMAHSGACPSFAAHQSAFEAAADAFADRGVAFLMVNSEAVAERGAVAASVPVLLDHVGIIGEALRFAAAGEVLLIDTADWRLAHRGGPGVDAALEAMLAGNAAPNGEPPSGCPAPAAASAGAEVSYAEDVAPILMANCVACHRQGGIGPWAMTDYHMVRGFAPMIREVIRTRRMPPWHADPAHGRCSNDRSLSAEEARALVHWAEAGAPRGEGPDPLAGDQRAWPEWALGEPDLVIDIPAYDVPATGVVEYQYQRVRNPLDRDVWVRAADILPGDRAALHHVITSFAPPAPAAEGGEGRDAVANRVDGRAGRRGGGLGGYVPGMVTDEFPDQTGTLLPANAVLIFQMHYTPYGKAVTDRSRLGLYFHERPPKHRLAGAALLNTKILIPPHAKAHSDSAERVFKRDVLVYDLLPHAHYRGKASEFRAFYPDGTEELLLSVPNYDFNWQTTYVFEEPKVLPAGTRLVHRTWWDNSAQNPANPDPAREVPWGRQSWDEMLFGALSFRYLEPEDGVASAPAGSADAGAGAD